MLGGLGLAAATVYHIVTELSGGRVKKAGKVDAQALFWKFSGKQIVFTIVVAVATIIAMFISLDLRDHAAKLDSDTDNRIKCLLREHSSPTGSLSRCERPEVRTLILAWGFS